MLTADFSRGLPDLRSGVYRHYKGPLYFVFGYGHDANAEEIYRREEKEGLPQFYRLGNRAVVIYMALELTEAHKGPRLAIRTAEDFLALVCQACGRDWECVVKEELNQEIHHPVPRFEYVGPEWLGQR